MVTEYWRGTKVDAQVQRDALLSFFEYKHLPEHLQKIAKPFCDMAHDLGGMPLDWELISGLRKLLEAKDCFVRATLKK